MVSAASYIGRVGGLAVALGIGAAITGGIGVAWAEDGGSTGGPSTSSHSDASPGPRVKANPSKSGAAKKSTVKSGSAAQAVSGDNASDKTEPTRATSARIGKAKKGAESGGADRTGKVSHAAVETEAVSTKSAMPGAVDPTDETDSTVPIVAPSRSVKTVANERKPAGSSATAALAAAAAVGSAPTTPTASDTKVTAVTNTAAAAAPNPIAAFFEKMRRTFFNATPTVTRNPSGDIVNADGTVSGKVIGYDRDGDVLTYTVGKTLNGGTVVIDGNGNFTYTPPAAGFDASGNTDLFTVTVSDASRVNGIHFHGLLGLLIPGYGSTASVSTAVDQSVTAGGSLGWNAPSYSTNFSSKSALGPYWQIYDGPGNGSHGVRTPDALSFANNVMTITGDAEGTTGGLAWWPGGRGQKYGMWEVRMRVPEGARNYNPVALLWPDSGNWPSDGEMDFMEIQRDPARQHVEAALHYGPTNQWVTTSVNVDATDWHNYAVSWTPTKITVYVDGVAFFNSTDVSKFPPGLMHLALQLDVGGPTIEDGGKMQVAWARQWAYTAE